MNAPVQLDLFKDDEYPACGVKLVIERLRTNPQDFNDDKWEWLTSSIYEYIADQKDPAIEYFIGLTKQEKDMLADAYTKYMREEFTTKVLRILTEADHD